MGNQQLALKDIENEIQSLESKFEVMLPPEISTKKFVQTVLNAIARTPELGNKDIDRTSLYLSCMECAQDGLVPDNKEAALVVFNTNVGDRNNKRFVKKVQYMPMISGLRKKVLSNPDIRKWDIRIVKQNDKFEYSLGTDEKIYHQPAKTNRGKTIAAYSIATLSDGERSIDVMWLEELEDVRRRSRDKDGAAWKYSTDEMYKKVLGHRHYKSLPHHASTDAFMQRFEEQFDLNTDQGEEEPPAKNYQTPENDESVVVEGTVVMDDEPEPRGTGGPPTPDEVVAEIRGATNEDDMTSIIAVINDLPDPKVKPGLMKIWREHKQSLGI